MLIFKLIFTTKTSICCYGQADTIYKGRKLMMNIKRCV